MEALAISLIDSVAKRFRQASGTSGQLVEEEFKGLLKQAVVQALNTPQHVELKKHILKHFEEYSDRVWRLYV